MRREANIFMYMAECDNCVKKKNTAEKATTVLTVLGEGKGIIIVWLEYAGHSSLITSHE